MTTVVYRDGVLAADTQITYGATIMPCKVKKLTKLPNGSLFGYCGAVELGEIMKKSLIAIGQSDGVLEDRRDLDKENFEGILVQPNGDTLFFENRSWINVKVPYVAMGSGKEHAYGALACGASAKQAVRASILLDPGSGGKVQAISIPWDKPQAYVEQMELISDGMDT